MFVAWRENPEKKWGKILLLENKSSKRYTCISI
jgi:hypothetical protein